MRNVTTEAYGITFQLDSGMDVVINSLKKFAMIEDKEKVAQDLELLFRTHLKDNIFKPEMGLDFAAITFNYADEVIKTEFTTALKQYRFINEILSIEVERIEDSGTMSFRINFKVKMYTGEELSLSVVI